MTQGKSEGTDSSTDEDKGPDKGRKDKRARILCKYIKDPALGKCPDGDHCPYAHNPDEVKPRNRKVKRKQAPSRCYECSTCDAMFSDKQKCESMRKYALKDRLRPL